MKTHADSALMQMLTGQMRYMSQRQSVLAQNIANLDSPGYKAQDLKKVDFASLVSAASGQLEMRTTSAKHIKDAGSGTGGFATEFQRETFERSPVGNNIVLEEQMAKVSDTGAQYQVASALFKKFTGLYRLALGNR